MPRLGLRDWLAYRRERAFLRRSRLMSKVRAWEGYEAQTPGERIAIGLAMSIAAAEAARETEQRSDQSTAKR